MRWGKVTRGVREEKGKQIIQLLQLDIQVEYRYDPNQVGFSWRFYRLSFNQRLNSILSQGLDNKGHSFPFRLWGLVFAPEIFSRSFTRWLASLPYETGWKQLIYIKSLEPANQSNDRTQGCCKDWYEIMFCLAQCQAHCGHLMSVCSITTNSCYRFYHDPERVTQLEGETGCPSLKVTQPKKRNY